MNNAMKKAKHQFKLSTQIRQRNSKKLLFYIVILALLVYAVMPKFHQLVLGVKNIRDADFNWILVAFMAIIMTHCAAALVYVILAKHPIKYFKTLAVQLAASFTNRLLPSGIGGISLFIDYLIKKDHKPSEATSVTAMNSVVAITSHLTLLISALFIGHSSFMAVINGRSISARTLIILTILLLFVFIILVRRKPLRRKVFRLIKDIWSNILEYRYHPFRVFGGIVTATAITAAYAIAFYASSHAMGLQLSMIQAFLIFTVGTVLGAAVLTPGGLGGDEAGLIAGIIAYHFDISLAFAAVIIYRFITFWLPIIPGYVAFWILRHTRTV